jgi:hypothetical protein
MKGESPNAEMGVIGYLLAACVAVLLLPVLPFIAVVWLAVRLSGENRTERETGYMG